MSERYKSSLILYLLSTIGFLTQFSNFSIISLCLLALTSYYYEVRSWSLSKTPRFVFVIIYLGALYFDLGSLWGLEAGVSFLSFLALLKTFELKEKRDLFIFSLIVQLSLIGHLLSVDDLYMVLVLLLIITNLFWLLYQFHHFDKSHVYSAEISRYKKKVFFQMIAWAIPLSLILFFIFPRFPLGNLFLNTMKKQNITGFTDQLRPGEINKVIQSKATYFRVQFNKLSPKASDFYWRGMVLAKTDGFNWDRIHLPHDSSVKNKAALTSFDKSKKSKKALYNYQVEYEFFSNGPLFLLDRPYEYDLLSRTHTVSMGAESFYSVPYRNQKIRYNASSRRRNIKRVKNKVNYTLTKNEKKLYLATPEVVKNIKFNQWILQNQKTNLSVDSILNLLRNHFDKEKFSYSLNPGRMDKESPLDDFFFNKKQGLCEHYASAVAIALRKFQVPARIVVGFQGGQYNPYGNYFYIEAKNAHSWVEYWSSKKGWQRIDPTSWIHPERIRLGPEVYFLSQENLESLNLDNGMNLNQGNIFQNLFLMADMLYFELNRQFLNFDFEKQEEIFDFLNLEGKFKYLKLLGLVVFMLFTIIGILIVYLLWQRRGKRDPMSELMSKLRSRLASEGVEVSKWWGPETIEQEMVKIYPNKALEISEICQLIREIRYEKGESLEKAEMGQKWKNLRAKIRKI